MLHYFHIVLVSFLVNIFVSTIRVFFSCVFVLSVCVFFMSLHPLTNHKIIFLSTTMSS